MTRRTMHRARGQETMERAQSEFYPKLKQASGFNWLSLIQGEDGIVTEVIVFDSKADAEAFQAQAADWPRTLDELGHRLESLNAGDVVQHVTAGG